jgi:Bifunctional DNA primase/polymerase, N-terminal
VIAENLDLVFKTVTITSRLHGERIFRRVRTEPYQRADGTQTTIDVWTGSCVICGASFEVRTSRATQKSKVFGVTTCDTHRKKRGPAMYRLMNAASVNPAPINAAKLHTDVAHNAEPEDEPSLLHELPTPTVGVITEDALKIKRHERFEKIKADRDRLNARPAPAPLPIDQAPPLDEAPSPAPRTDESLPPPQRDNLDRLFAPITAQRKKLLANGYVPIPTRGKKPTINEWPKIQPTENEIEKWQHQYPAAQNTGILVATNPAIDIDVNDADVAEEIQTLLFSMIGDTGHMMVRYGKKPKRAILFQTDRPFSKKSTPIFRSPDQRNHRVETLCDGQQIIVFGVHPDTGAAYTWEKGDPGEVARDALPHMDEICASQFIAAATALMRAKGWVPINEGKPVTNVTAPTAATADDNVVPFKPREPKEKVSKEPGAASRPSRTSRQKKKAAVALERNAAELAETKAGNRNNRLNALAYRSGRMVAPGSITQQQVIDAFIRACEANGLIGDDGIDSVMRTIKSGLDAGMKKPLEDLAAISSDKERGENPYKLEMRRSEIMALHRLRFGPHASYADVDDFLAKIDSDDKYAVGRELQFTFAEYKRMGVEPLGRRRAKHPQMIQPFGPTHEEIEGYLKEFEKSRNSAIRKEKRAKLAEAIKAAKDLDDRPSAVLTFLQHSAEPQTMAQLMAGVRESDVFAELTDKSLRSALLRLLKPPSKLATMVVVTEGETKNGKKTFIVELRK